jgi:hypothetical protein
VGLETQCTASWRDKKGTGKAHLEGEFLLFHSPEFRLKIPAVEMREARAEGGVLTIAFGQGDEAAFELGEPAAAKWADRIANPPSRLDKLGIRPGLRVIVSGLDELGEGGFVEEVRGRGAEIVGRGELAGCDLIFLGAKSSADLVQVRAFAKVMAKNGAIWIVYPKGRKDIAEKDVMSVIKGARLVDTKVAAFSKTLTALKAMIPRVRR